MSDLDIVEGVIAYLKRFTASGKRYGLKGQIANLRKVSRKNMSSDTRNEIFAVMDMLEGNFHGDAATAHMALNRLARYLSKTWRLSR